MLKNNIEWEKMIKKYKRRSRASIKKMRSNTKRFVAKVDAILLRNAIARGDITSVIEF